VAQVVTLGTGRLAGERERGVWVYRGIPYARPPVGPLRWSSPEPPAPWSGVRDARRSGPAAPQPGPVTRILRALSPPPEGQSEDCLRLDVWTPRADGRRRPVLVWLHGGAFVLGTGASRLYAGARLAREGDLVVVAPNYRLGALGFLNLRALRPGDPELPANLGLLDQIAALRWVRQNIEAFGGDPERVTVFGESAGAMSVATLLGAPRARDLFRGAICQSGAAHHVASGEQAARVARRFLEALGLGEPDLGALRARPVGEILAAQQATTLALRLPLGQLTWQPSLDGDLLPRPPLEAIAEAAAPAPPLLVGTNLDEWKLFMLADLRGRRLDEAGLRARLERTFAANGGEPAHARVAFEVYRAPDPLRPGAAPWERWAAFQGDRVFHVPAARLAEARAAGGRTWAYLFTWAPPLLRRRVGSCHGLEIPFVFGSLHEPWLRALFGGPLAPALSRRMQRAWIEFARSGRPADDALPDWPAWEPARRATRLFGRRDAVLEAPLAATLAFWDGRL
jgi:para-nitrobenzyl esterase